MTSPFHDRRTSQLLDSADSALERLRGVSQDGSDTADVMKHLDLLHRDIGRRLHELWQGRDTEDIGDIEPLDDFVELESLDAHHITPAPAPQDPGQWVEALQDTMALLDAPNDDSDAVALAHEASRIQWATVGLAERWAGFPNPIQVALLGLLGARCRRLSEHLTIDVGAKAALSRLADYQLQTGLATVVALVPDREPESGNWTQDALHWWEMLTSGIEA